MATDEEPAVISPESPPMNLADLVAQAVLDKIEDREHLDEFLDEVIARVNEWRGKKNERQP